MEREEDMVWGRGGMCEVSAEGGEGRGTEDGEIERGPGTHKTTRMERLRGVLVLTRPPGWRGWRRLGPGCG